MVVGKFYPLHKGHDYLIQTALQHCDRLTIMVVDSRGQQPPGPVREAWLKQAYSAADVRLIDDIYNDDDSQAWADYVVQLLGRAPDVVFTSEAYGDPWAAAMGCEHMLVDLERKTVPISGTKVRQDPLASWQFLDPDVRAYYAKRVVIVGADSTGKTTLTEALAKHYRTSWAPEYGRLYTLGKVTSRTGAEWDSAELQFIAEEQNRLEDRLAGYSNHILFCDTDSFTTALWAQALDRWSEELEQLFVSRRYDLYLLADTDIAYQQDDIRFGEDFRQALQQRFITMLKQYTKPYQLISGTRKQRLGQAVKLCDQLIGK